MNYHCKLIQIQLGMPSPNNVRQKYSACPGISLFTKSSLHPQNGVELLFPELEWSEFQLQIVLFT